MTSTQHKVYLENVRDLVSRPGEMRETQRTLDVPEQLGEALAIVPAGEKLDLDLRFESVHEGILVTATAETKYHAECGRCLEPFTQGIEVEFTELFAYTISEADEYGVHGDHVNLEPPLRDAVVLALPFQPVCRPDCVGLDPQTGELRADGEEAAADQGFDPRWAALESFRAENVQGESDSAQAEK